MPKTKNPGRGRAAHRVLKVKAFSSSIDNQNPTENHPEIQSEMLTVFSIMRRFRVSFHHAKVVCQLHGLGGQRV